MEENIIVVDYTRHASQKTKAKLRENGGNCFYLLEEHQDVLVLGNKPGILVRKFAGGDCYWLSLKEVRYRKVEL